MRKEYIKPLAELIRLETENAILDLSQSLSDGKGQEDIDFGSHRKHQWDDEEAWDDFEDEADY